MRCGCPKCGIYMVQHEQGLQSACVCPACLFSCNACMGTEQPPVEKDEAELRQMLMARVRQIETEQYDEDKGDGDPWKSGWYY